MDSIPIILFLLVFILILLGYPVALTLGGISVIAGLLFFDIDFFYLVSLRIYGIMNNFVLLAVPLFIFMGLTLEKSGIAERLLETMAILFGKIRGGLAYSVIIVGGMLAASTGIVGATVVTMGLISLPTMLKRGYDKKLATGVIASSGTLGQIIPPSVVLVLLGSVLNVSVGNLFISAVLPGITLVVIYIIYVYVVTLIKPEYAPPMPDEIVNEFKKKTSIKKVINAFLLPFILIFAVLGSIFFGIASPTEAAGIGAAGALFLSFLQGSLNIMKIKEISSETTKLTSIVFMILLGATSFSLVFRGLEGDKIIVDLITSSSLSPEIFLVYVLVTVFVAGFFIDFIEIIFIVVPVITPILLALNIDLIWVGIMLAINLQTSFLTPPFGFSLFYLKSVSPKDVRTMDIYKGVLPFVLIQILFLLYLFLNPDFIYIVPELISGYKS
tara:strand:- start:633 stop:1958 length:1326 start_codon:yes stop_codon:yes gene_type:complete